jgi:hypothetical protein
MLIKTQPHNNAFKPHHRIITSTSHKGLSELFHSSHLMYFSCRTVIPSICLFIVTQWYVLSPDGSLALLLPSVNTCMPCMYMNGQNCILNLCKWIQKSRQISDKLPWLTRREPTSVWITITCLLAIAGRSLRRFRRALLESVSATLTIWGQFIYYCFKFCIYLETAIKLTKMQ